MAFLAGVAVSEAPELPELESSPPHPAATTPNTSRKAAIKIAARLRFGTACPPEVKGPEAAAA
jgi:hypothetical protein